MKRIGFIMFPLNALYCWVVLDIAAATTTTTTIIGIICATVGIVIRYTTNVIIVTVVYVTRHRAKKTTRQIRPTSLVILTTHISINIKSVARNNFFIYITDFEISFI
jgi:hypothetical protein